MLSIDDVERTVRQVQRHVLMFQPNPPAGDINIWAPANNHETSTRYLIIDPILRALGWDLSDPSECIVEYRIKERLGGTKWADYALLDDQGNPVILVEAKRIDVHTEEGENWCQVDEYLKGVNTARTVVVTNGQYWAIEVRTERRRWRLESNRPLGLHWGDAKETAERLHKHLAKPHYR